MIHPRETLNSINEELHWCLQKVIPVDTLISYYEEYMRPSLISNSVMMDDVTADYKRV